jgi:hypothetical protein
VIPGLEAGPVVQSWQGLGANEDERYRIAATADGGVFVLHTIEHRHVDAFAHIVLAAAESAFAEFLDRLLGDAIP